MGTHPDGPAKVRKTAECLSSLIARSDSSTNLLNNNAAAALDVQEVHLPFIMKIMSIKHTLSLQVHPTKVSCCTRKVSECVTRKRAAYCMQIWAHDIVCILKLCFQEQAAYLHARDPINYPDRNHKPELAYALTRFELLCGFRPAEQILQNMQCERAKRRAAAIEAACIFSLSAFPELAEVMGVENCEEFGRLVCAGVSQESDRLKVTMRACFSTMMYAQVERPQLVVELINSLKARIEAGGKLARWRRRRGRRLAGLQPLCTLSLTFHMLTERGCLIEDTVRTAAARAPRRCSGRRRRVF